VPGAIIYRFIHERKGSRFRLLRSRRATLLLSAEAVLDCQLPARVKNCGGVPGDPEVLVPPPHPPKRTRIAASHTVFAK
jgi:hypothetical protein